MKIFSFMMTGACMLAASSLMATPVFNPANPVGVMGVVRDGTCDWFGVKFGYFGDYLFQNNVKSVATGAKVSHYSSFQNSGILAINFLGRVDLYGCCGSFNFCEENVIGTNDIREVSDFGSIWTVGVKGVIWEGSWGSFGSTIIGIDGKYCQTSRIPLSYLTENGDLATQNVSSRTHINQFSIGIAQHIKSVIPYTCLYWQNSRGIAHGAYNGVAASSLRSCSNIGIAIGVTLLSSGGMGVTAEARFITEQAFAVNGIIRF